MTATAFSNHSEFETWAARWCAKCARDEMGLAPQGTFCSILGIATLDNRVPPQWIAHPELQYCCTEFRTGLTSAYPEQWHAPLCLSQDGSVVHKVGCALAFGGKPWTWSGDQTMDACRELAKLAGWTACQFCGPFK